MRVFSPISLIWLEFVQHRFSSACISVVVSSPASQLTYAMRLTVELIENSLSYINPLKERELDLRGG